MSTAGRNAVTSEGFRLSLSQVQLKAKEVKPNLNTVVVTGRCVLQGLF